jgi:hypothetical protein
MSNSSSELNKYGKHKTGMKQVGLFSVAENGGDMFFRNVGAHSAYYAAVYRRRQNSSVFVVSFCLFVFLNYIMTFTQYHM